MAANADIAISVNSSYTKVAALATYSGNPKLSKSTTLATTDISYVIDKVQTATTGAVTYDVTNLTDDYNAAVNMANVKGFFIYNNNASASLTVGGGANPLFGTDQYTVKAGNLLAVTSAFATTGTAKNIQVTPSASATWQLLLLGN